MVKQGSQGKEDRRQLPKEGQGMNIIVEDMDRNIREDIDTQDILGRKVKEKDKEETIELGEHDLEHSTKIACVEVMRWTMQKI